MEDFGFYHKKVRLRFEIRDITSQLDNPGDHEQNLVQYNSRFPKGASASYPAINKVLKRVRVGSTSADDEESSSHDDVEEEGRERKRRKIRVRESESCTVCMEQFKGGSTVVYMPCFHVFHGRCIVKWLRKSHYCPVCRFQVLTDSNQKV
ncbi:hypothetical protein D8674_016240 [Pyrus ussuriensis x Pyrus communis]|uniref:RING-type E3 ubiquitin transferase n=1 Tax=Pyrus ussuriensis x Pyrus communis TaxID=2448454 RepID=A0A5N5HGK1_9ROSA|nr:hypothetical protein D8674_016240 [Pyrus ussuriensis x Pyrus communis]